jgi:hypothetical protein
MIYAPPMTLSGFSKAWKYSFEAPARNNPMAQSKKVFLLLFVHKKKSFLYQCPQMTVAREG